ncbi:MAG: superoxide dismutase [Candidatus Komeilibacteria bacterium]|jgi:superoxide dismutase, Fe-Mn family|nr:superoxide dismutase [Candidatus Komeilibacteria bacterium]MBT4447365.1 superoxide dismutase [Candidatus Komeilibacteria bacterium]
MSKFETPALPYEYNALEPYIDEATMKIHHDKHHVAYTANFNKALEAYPKIAEQSAEDILANINSLPEEIRSAVKNHGGGHVHHSFFWEIMAPANESGQPEGELLQAINDAFGSPEKFKEEFTKAAMTVFGSGWAWLSVADGKLIIEQTSKQDSPYSLGHIPILSIDVWEHSYYLKYQNRRAEFVENFFNVINWLKVAEKYQATK